jgi:hypothetical protein
MIPAIEENANNSCAEMPLLGVGTVSCKFARLLSWTEQGHPSIARSSCRLGRYLLCTRGLYYFRRNKGLPLMYMVLELIMSSWQSSLSYVLV